MAENLKGSIKSFEKYYTDAYQVAVQNGYPGTVLEWLKSLKGKDGYSPKKGVDYFTEADKTEIINTIKQSIKVAPARIVDVELSTDWRKVDGYENLYSQEVEIAGVTANSQVDLTPDAEQLAIFHNKDLAFVTENIDGNVIVYAIGQMPTSPYTIQATITEVSA